MKSLLYMRAINEQLRADPQPGAPKRVTLREVRRLLQDMEARYQETPTTWDRIKQFVQDNWVDILKALLSVIMLLAEERKVD